MKKILLAASALVLSLGIGFTVLTTDKVQAANSKCEVTAEVAEGIDGKRMYDPHAGVTKKFVKKDGKAYIRAVVTGENCTQDVSLVAWKASSISGKPYKQQVILDSVSRTLKPGSTTLNVEIPQCFFQIDFVRGLNPKGIEGGGAYQEGRMIHSVHGGDKTCFPAETPKAPEGQCVNLNISGKLPRTVTITDFKTSVKNGATYKRAVINWGDGTTTNVTNNAVNTSHDYAKDGKYTVKATAYFTVNGQEKQAAANVNCEKSVTVKADQPPVVTPPATPPTPEALPNTGAGAVAVIFTGVSTFAGAAHFFIGRRLGL